MARSRSGTRRLAYLTNTCRSASPDRSCLSASWSSAKSSDIVTAIIAPARSLELRSWPKVETLRQMEVLASPGCRPDGRASCSAARCRPAEMEAWREQTLLPGRRRGSSRGARRASTSRRAAGTYALPASAWRPDPLRVPRCACGMISGPSPPGPRRCRRPRSLGMALRRLVAGEAGTDAGKLRPCVPRRGRGAACSAARSR